MRQKQQVVILNDFHVAVFSRNTEVCRTGSSLDAGAGKCLQFNVCMVIFWSLFMRELSKEVGSHHHEQTTGNVTFLDRSLKPGLSCWRDGHRFSLNGSLYSV